MPTEVILEWRRGVNGDLGTFSFNPKPAITRVSPGKRSATLVVPLLDGEIVQNLGLDAREIRLNGTLFLPNAKDWDSMETERNNLINGIGTGPGQLHIISALRHIRYDGQVATDGIQFDEQERALNFHDYQITIRIPNAKELNVVETTKTLNSDAEVAL